jgi:hypothetical protein
MSVTHVFTCARCSRFAGSLTVFAAGEAIPYTEGDDLTADIVRQQDNQDGSRPRLKVISGIVGITFTEFNAARASAAVARGDARELYGIDREMVPFWCPTCHESYCTKHWDIWDVFDESFFDERRGRCPKGHERQLSD